MAHPEPLAPSLGRPTITEWLANPFVQTLTTSESLGWNNVTVHSVNLKPTADLVTAPQRKDETLILVAGSTRMEARVMGRYYDWRYVPGDLILYPRHSESSGRWDSPAKIVLIDLAHQNIVDIASATLRGDPAHIEMLFRVGFNDPLLRHLATELHREMQNHSLFGQLFAESVATTMVLHLLRNYSNISALHEVGGGRLTTLQLRLVDEYIDAHLHHRIALADLAGCLHLSIPHFEKLFRATRHCPPYRYVLERRIERAKMLLSATRLPLHDVALECGFANQSHFTRHFTRFVGVSPARFMQGARN